MTDTLRAALTAFLASRGLTVETVISVDLSTNDYGAYASVDVSYRKGAGANAYVEITGDESTALLEFLASHG